MEIIDYNKVINHNLSAEKAIPGSLSILDEDDKTKLMCLSGVKQYPMRVKCATLSWHTLVSAMENDGKQVSTED